MGSQVVNGTPGNSGVTKIVLIKSNLVSSLHVMNCFKLTKSNNEDLDKINRKFLWAPNLGCKEAKGFPLVAWNEVCRPKFEGRLEIKRNVDVNNATISKLGWRILKDKDCVWIRIMRDKYVKENNFFSIQKKGDSVVWKEVINHRKYIGVGLKWCIGDGRKVCFWIDNWDYMTPLISFVDENNLHFINRDAKVHEFID